MSQRNILKQLFIKMHRSLLQVAIGIFLLSVTITGCSRQESGENKELIEKNSISTHSEGNNVPKTGGTPNSVVQTPGLLPKMLDLGADKCIPCKAMAPILEELRTEYRNKVDVVFVDVWKNPTPGKEAKVRVIPTQIFYDTTGKEVFRHEGFYSKEKILSKWRELGFKFE